MVLGYDKQFNWKQFSGLATTYDPFSSVLRHCWLGNRKGIRRVKSWVLVCQCLGGDDLTGALHVLYT